MPLQTTIDRGLAGRPVPLEDQAEGTGAGVSAAFYGSWQDSLGALGGQALQRATAGGIHVSHDDAVKRMQGQGYDITEVPTGGLTSGALQAIMDRQADIAAHRSIAESANLSGVVSFGASLAGSLADPVNIPLLAISPGAAVGRTLLGRAAVGVAVGAGITAGQEAVRLPLARYMGDDYKVQDALRNIALGGGMGGGLHMVFGARSGAVAVINRILLREGGMVVDTGGLTKFGISAKAHPGVDIANLTREDAVDIIRREYWNKIGGDKLPPELQDTALDAAVNQGVGNARKWLVESGGDVTKFNALRREHYETLALLNPEKYGKYLKTWLSRLNDKPAALPEHEVSETVDAMDPDTRDAIGRTAISQALHDSPVEVEPVVMKAASETWGVKASEFDPTGMKDNPYLDPLAGHEQTIPGATLDREFPVIRNRAEAVADTFRGTTKTMDDAVPKPNTILRNDDAVKIIEKQAKDNETPAASTSGPLTAEANAQAADAVREAKEFSTTIGAEEDTALKEDLVEHAEAIAEAQDFSTAVQAAVNCALKIGEG